MGTISRRGSKLGHLALQIFQPRGDVGQVALHGEHSLALADGHVRRTQNNLAGFHGFGDSALHAGHHAVADFQMSDHAHLSAQHDVMAQRRAARDAALRDQNAVRPDPNVVGEHHQIVDLRALADDGVAQRGAIDRAVGADFDIVFDDDIADLRDFVMHAVAGGVAESIAADDDAGVQNHPLAQDAALVDHDVGIDDAVRSDLHLRADVCPGINHRAGADGRGRIDKRLGMHALMRVGAMAVQRDDRLLKRQVRIFRPQRGHSIALDG